MAFPTASSHKAKSPQLCRPQFLSSHSTEQAFPLFSSVSLSYRRQTLAQMLRQNFRPELLNACLAGQTDTSKIKNWNWRTFTGTAGWLGR